MTFEDLKELLEEQFCCDADELETETSLRELDADHEDMIELAWALSEELDTEIDEDDLSEDLTVGELWRFVRDHEEDEE